MLRLHSLTRALIISYAAVSIALLTFKSSSHSLSFYFSLRESSSDVVKEAAKAFNSGLIPLILEKSEKQPSRISYTLHPKYLQPYNQWYRCPIVEGGPKIRARRGLPAEMNNTMGVLDFTTSVTTDLKILFMGDSVSMQWSQGFEEAAGALHAHRAVIRYSWGSHEGLTVSAPV
jgi:hypothetical protein